jgi:hypothetical protein
MIIGLHDAVVLSGDAIGSAIDDLESSAFKLMKAWTDGGQCDQMLMARAAEIIGVVLRLKEARTALNRELELADGINAFIERSHDAPIH